MALDDYMSTRSISPSRQYAAAWLLALIVVLVPTTLVGQEPDTKIREIEARFVSPCCWRENLAVHDSQVAEQLRALVARKVESGQTESQIVDYMVARFGERILREPRGNRFRFLTITPIVALGIGFLAVVRFLLRARHLAQLAELKINTISPLPMDYLEWQ